MTQVRTITAADTIGDLDAPVGTKLWCLGMRYRIQQLLDQHKTDHDSLQRCVESFTIENGWKQLTDDNGNPFTSYSTFCKAKKPHGLGRDSAEIDQLLKEGAARKAKDIAADPDVKPVAEHGGNRRNGEADQVANGHLRPANQTGGNSAERLIRRLKRDAPEVAQALANGEYKSARAAAIAAGIIREPTNIEKAQKAYVRLNGAERKRFISWVEKLT